MIKIISCIVIAVFVSGDAVYSIDASCLRVGVATPEASMRQSKAALCLETIAFLEKESVDSAPNSRKAQLIVDSTFRLSQMLWKNEKYLVSPEKLKQIEDRHNKFLTSYYERNGFSASLENYFSIDYKLLIRIDEDACAAPAQVNRKWYFLRLSKDGNFKFIPVGAKDEIERYAETALGFAEEETRKSVSRFFDWFKQAAERADNLKESEKEIGRLPDISYLASLPVRELPKMQEAGALPSADDAEYEIKDIKLSGLSDLVEEGLLKPIESLIRKDSEGHPRILTKEEMMTVAKEGGERALETRDYEIASDFKDLIKDALEAVKSGDMKFKRTVKREPLMPDTLSFPELRGNARRDVLTAATIPIDGKIWIFLKEDMYLYQAAYILARIRGIDQKMVIIDLERDYYDYITGENFSTAVIKEAYKQTGLAKDKTVGEEKRLDFHNRFLQRLHYSYKVDMKFKEDIDSLRTKILDQIGEDKGGTFRFITDNRTLGFALEFAMRAGEKPFEANPYIAGSYANIFDEQRYFMDYSEIYKRYKNEFGQRFLSRSDLIIEHDPLKGGLRLMGGASHFKNVFRVIFTYNEAVAFFGNEEDRKFINPVLEPYKTTWFSLPGADFTRPSEEDAFRNMLPDQLFQALEGFSSEEWDMYKNEALKRYSYFALKGEIKENLFIEHLYRLADKDFTLVWERDKKMWEEGNAYYLKRAERTRAVIETVLRFSKPDFLSDDFLARYYSRADDRRISDKHISQADAINNISSFYDEQAPICRSSLYVLSMIMDIFPQRIGPKMINFLVAVADAARDRYKLYIEDEFGVKENSYGAVPIFDIPFEAFDAHPEYYAGLLLRSSLTPDILTFLIKPKTAPSNKDIFSLFFEPEFGEEEKEDDKTFISDNMLGEMVRQNSLEGRQFKILKSIIKYSPKVASDSILKHWRDFTVEELTALLDMKAAAFNSSHFEKMEYLFREQKLNNRATALFLALYPDFKMGTAKALDLAFEDDSAQVVFKLLKAVRNKEWREEEVKELYGNNLWSFASANVRHCYLQQILKLSKEDRFKFFTAFSIKRSKPQILFDIFPLNIPANHALYDQYRHELRYYSMAYSSFASEGTTAGSRESEEDVKRRINHRARLLFNDLEAVLKLPREELSRRTALLKNFETNNAEMDSTAYRLLMVVPKEHFEELYAVLENSFEDLKGFGYAKKEMASQFRNIVGLNPELKDLSQKAIVRWAARQLGITSGRRFAEPDAKQYIAKAFRSELARDRLGEKTIRGKATEEEKKRFMTLVAANKLLSVISGNLKSCRAWLEEIADIETDPGRMLPRTFL